MVKSLTFCLRQPNLRMKYWKARQLSSQKFRRLTGISPRTYRLMVRLVKVKEAGKKKPGRPSKLRIEEQVLMVIQYWREYRSYYHIGLDWGISESAGCRTVHKIENTLIRSRKFSLPGKKKLLDSSLGENIIVME